MFSLILIKRFTNNFYISTNKPIPVVPRSSLQTDFADFGEPPLPMLSKENPIKAKVNLSLACQFLSEHFQRFLVSVLNSQLSFFFVYYNLFTTSYPPNIRIPILQIFLFVIEGGQENIFYWSKIFFGPMKNIFLSPFNK